MALITALNEIVQVLHPHQAKAAATAIRNLAGDEDAKQLYVTIADTMEQDVNSRALREVRASGGKAPDSIGKLDKSPSMRRLACLRTSGG